MLRKKKKSPTVRKINRKVLNKLKRVLPFRIIGGYNNPPFFIMTTLELRNKILNMDIDLISQNSIEETKDGIIERQQEQLRYGLNAKGETRG